MHLVAEVKVLPNSLVVRNKVGHLLNAAKVFGGRLESAFVLHEGADDVGPLEESHNDRGC